MRKMGWLLGFASAWGAALGCSERTLPLGEGPTKGGEAGADEGGTSAQGGSAQQGGRAQGGTSTGGAGGEGSGAGARGGAAPSGGRAGDGGQADAGAGQGGGGDGGRGGDPHGGTCNDKQGPLLTFPECPRPTFASTGIQIGSSCSLADTVKELACGEPSSNMDANCCLRSECRNDSDCGSNAVCISRLAQSMEIGGSQFEDCSMQCGECACSVYADIDGGGYCFPRDQELPRFNCDTSALSCSELGSWRTTLRDIEALSPDDRTATGLTSRALSIVNCEDKLDQALSDRCGAPSKCDCSGEDCTIALGDFRPLIGTLGDTRTGYNLKAIRETCKLLDYGDGRYSECADGTARYEITEGGENLYEFVFPLGKEQLSYGRANGYVGGLCAMSGEHINLHTGPAPAATTCRTCAYCEDDEDSSGAGGAGGAGSSLPKCVFDQAGKISLPPP